MSTRTASFSMFWSRAGATKRAAKRLFRKLLRKQGRAPRVLVTDKLKSYAAAKREIMPGVEHRQHKGLDNRVENSHEPTRRRERTMKRFKSPRQAQRFLSTHDQVANCFLLPPGPRHCCKPPVRPHSGLRHLGRRPWRCHGRIIMRIAQFIALSANRQIPS
jgi:hypothetical protein